MEGKEVEQDKTETYEITGRHVITRVIRAGHLERIDN